MKFSSNSNTSVQRCLYPLFQNQRHHFLLLPFFEEFLNPQARINIMLNEHTVDYHPSPSELTSRIHPLIFLWTPKEFSSLKYILNFFSNLYIPPWLRKSFKFTVLILLENTFVSQKKGISSFLIIPQSKTLPQVLIITSPGRRKLPISPEQRFFENLFFPSTKGGGLWS